MVKSRIQIMLDHPKETCLDVLCRIRDGGEAASIRSEVDFIDALTVDSESLVLFQARDAPPPLKVGPRIENVVCLSSVVGPWLP